MDKVPNVIESVLKLCGKKGDRIPSESTIRNINVRKIGLTQMQLCNTLPQQNDMTLYTDETSKKGKKYTGYHLSDKEGNMYVLGLREMSSKSSKETLETFKEILSDLDSAIQECENEIGNKVLKNIRCTMSDQASTCKAFNELLEDYRKSVLPSVQENWSQLSEKEKSVCSKMYNFFCGLHILVNLAEVTSKTIKEFEVKSEISKKGAAAESGLVYNASGSGTVRLVRTACKAFTRGADEKSGAYRAFTDYLISKGKTNKLVNFKGNRFNVLFLDSGLVFFYVKDISHFLKNVHGTPNGLLRTILADCQCEEYLAGAKALDILEKLITTPLWRVIESDSHILSMNTHYTNLVDFLDRMSANPSGLLDGTEKPFPDKTTVETDDPVLSALLEPQDFDPFVSAILQCVLSAWSAYLKHAVKDHLPGGVLSEVSDNLMEQARSVQKHNKFAERIFGMLDHLIMKRPNATTLANEAFIAFSVNKTSEWLSSKDDEVLKNIIKQGRKVGKEIKSKFKERMKEIQRKNIEVQKMKESEKERKRLKAIQEKEDLTKEIEWFGLWQSRSSVFERLKEIKSQTEKKRALTTQLKFRKLVLNQTHPDMTVFNTTKKQGKDLTVSDLTENVIKLVEDALTSHENTEKAIPHMPLLVDKDVEHKFENGEVYRAHVISVVPGYISWYNIKYVDDPAIYTYQLQEDYLAGNLKIVVPSSRYQCYM